MKRLAHGLLNIFILLFFMTVVLSFLAGIAWMIANATWLNLVWIIPALTGACWIMGDNFE